MCFFVQTNHTRKELLFLMFKEINLRNHSSLHKLFYSLEKRDLIMKMNIFENLDKICSTKSFWSTMIIFSMILFIISLRWLCHKRYTSTQFLDNITKDPKSSSILLVSFLGLYL